MQTSNVAAIVEVNGAMQIIEKRPETISIWIAPPSISELKRRLAGRGTETEEQIAKRLEIAQHEMTFAPRYRYQIVNGDLESAYRSLSRLYRIVTAPDPFSAASAHNEAASPLL